MDETNKNSSSFTTKVAELNFCKMFEYFIQESLPKYLQKKKFVIFVQVVQVVNAVLVIRVAHVVRVVQVVRGVQGVQVVQVVRLPG